MDNIGIVVEDKLIIPIGSFYPDQIGGPSNTMFWHARALVERGWNVTVVTRQYQFREKIPSNKFIDLEGIYVVYATSPLRFLFCSVNEIRKSSIVHLNSLFYWPNIILFLIAKMLRKKIIWSVRGELEPAALKYRNFFKLMMLYVIRATKGSCVFHGTSENEIMNIKTCLKTRLVIHLPNYIPVKIDLKQSSQSTRIRRILFLGRIHPIKNLEFLIGAFAQSGLQDVHLLIAGSGNDEYMTGLKDLVNLLNLNNVEFVGHVDGELKTTLLQSSMCLVLPSKSENFGNVVVEALANGTPVIASTNTPWSILEENGAGWYLPLDLEQWASVLREYFLSGSEALVMEKSEKAKKLVLEKFSTSKGVDKWLKAFHTLWN